MSKYYSTNTNFPNESILYICGIGNLIIYDRDDLRSVRILSGLGPFVNILCPNNEMEVKSPNGELFEIDSSRYGCSILEELLGEDED